MASDVICLCNMCFYGQHGFTSEEKILGQRFEVDVELLLDTQAAGSQDDLSLTINYAQVYKAVKSIVEEECFDLIESMAETIAIHIGQHFSPNGVRVRVRKPHVPIKGILDYVAVAIERTEEAWK